MIPARGEISYLKGDEQMSTETEGRGQKPVHHTNETLMREIFKIIETMPDFERARDILDYMLPETYRTEKLTNYEFDFLAVPNFGGSEGIYIDCYLSGVYKAGDNENRRLSAGTLKTLGTSLEDMKTMGELCGIIEYVANRYINQNLYLFEENIKPRDAQNGSDIKSAAVAETKNPTAIAKEIMGDWTIVTNAQRGKTYGGKIIGITGDPPDRTAIQRINSNLAILHRIKDISSETNLYVGADVLISRDKNGKTTIKPEVETEQTKGKTTEGCER
jgi:hypothetical protein